MKLLMIGAVAGLALAQVGGAQWLPPVEHPELNTATHEYGPCLSPDGKTLYFTSFRTSDWELYRATRTVPYGPFTNVTPIAELNAPGVDAGPCIRADNLEIFFYTGRPGVGGSFDIWRATRAKPSEAFSAPTPVVELGSSAAESGPSITADGLTIWFSSTRGGALGSWSLWTATRPSLTAPFSTPVPAPELNSTANDTDPHISADGLTIVFESTRNGGTGSADLWIATRPTPTSTFSAPTNLSLNSTVADDSPALSSAGDELFFCSTRPGGTGSSDIYASRLRGLAASGLARPANPVLLTFSDPGASGSPYLAAASLGDRPGIPVDTRVIPLVPDALFALSVGGLTPLLTGFAGRLDANGVANGQILIPYPALVGVRFYSAFIVLDASAPSGIRTIGAARPILIQR